MQKSRILKNTTAISTTLLVVAIVVVVVVVGAGVYYLATQNYFGTQQSADIVTPTASPEATATVSPSETSTPNVAEASSLKYSVTVTTSDEPATSYTFWGKKAASGELMMRIEYQTSEGDMIYIFNGAQQKAWMMTNNEWIDISSTYNTYYQAWDESWSAYVDTLDTEWAGTGDYTYSAAGTTVRIYDISVDSIIDDSLFEHT